MGLIVLDNAKPKKVTPAFPYPFDRCDACTPRGFQRRISAASTEPGSNASLADMSRVQTKSHDEFWHFYRSASSLADMLLSETNKSHDEEGLKTSRLDSCSGCDWWKLPLPELPGSFDESGQDIQIPVSQTRGGFKQRMLARSSRRFQAEDVSSRGCFTPRMFSKRKAQDIQEANILAVLANQIY